MVLNLKCLEALMKLKQDGGHNLQYKAADLGTPEPCAPPPEPLKLVRHLADITLCINRLNLGVMQPGSHSFAGISKSISRYHCMIFVISDQALKA